MRTYLDFEKPVAELEAKVEELRAMLGRRQRRRDRRRDRPAGGQGGGGARGTLRRAHAVAEDAGRPPSAAPALPRLHRRADRRLHAARRRPQIRRGRSDRRRLRPFPRRKRLRHRPREGLRHRRPAQAQFRHGAAGRLSQGGAADGDGRPLRHPGASRWSTPPAPIRASAPRSAARPRRSRARPRRCLNLGVPNVAVILGEGGSGGAVAIATANRVLMLEHAIYSVISPEGAASILWRDTTQAQDAATNMKITARRPDCGSASSTGSSPSRSAARIATRPSPLLRPATRSSGFCRTQGA